MTAPGGGRPGAALDVHVVPHTHWDREWYHPVGRFRQRLVALVDELLDAPPRDGESFLLDGQAIVLEDYLHVQPDRASELSALLARGALEAGPWYVLADELIPGGEALVRNLLAGRRGLARLGASPPPVLYCPDSFGHPAALPTLAAGFGCPLIVLWRGLGGRRWPAGDTFRWRGADRSAALVFHLPPDGYEYGSTLPADEVGARERWSRMRAELAPRSRTGVLLIQNGADHHARQRSYDEAVAALERAASPDRLHRSSLARFAGALLDRSRDADVPVIEGELRDSYGYTWALQGTFATRAHEKRLNARAERLLVRDAEPWAALAGRNGVPSRRPLLEAAWRTLLRCHPHDTLCGCSVDEVARAMETRLEDALVQGRGIRDDALLDLARHDPVEARERKADWRSVLVVRNAAARPRGGVAEVELLTFLGDVPVGPGSAHHEATRDVPEPVTIDAGTVPLQVLATDVRHDRIESPRHYPDNDLVEARRALAWVPAIRGYGIRALPLGPPRRGVVATGPRAPALAADRTIENGLLRATLGDDGRLRLEALDASFSSDDLLRFESRGDLGDLYTASPRGEWQRAEFVRARVVARGPLRATIEARWRSRVPAHRYDRRRRAPEMGIELLVRLSLDAESPALRVEIRGENRARDHRLRAVFSSGIAGAETWADAAFGPVRRAGIVVDPADLAKEAPPPTAPLHRYVSLFSAERGATMLSDGLAEYESTAEGDIAVTLVRAVGELSRTDLPERPGHAGWPSPTPGAQCPGPFRARLAFFPHAGRDAATIESIEQLADDFLLPLIGTTLRSALALPEPTHGVELEGRGLAFSTCKESEDGEFIVLRCVNLLEEPVEGSWLLGFPFTEARLARLDETPGDMLVVDADRIRFPAGPRAVTTVLVR